MRMTHCDRAECHGHWPTDRVAGTYTITVGQADGELLELHACNAHCAVAVIGEHANATAGALVFAATAKVRHAIDQLDGIREDLHDRPIVQGALDNVRDALDGVEL